MPYTNSPPVYDASFWIYILTMLIIIVLSWVGFYGSWLGKIQKFIIGHGGGFILIVPIVGTIIAFLYAWSAYEVDALSINDNLRTVFQWFYAFIIIFYFLRVIFGYFAKNIDCAIICNYFVIVMLVGMCLLYPQVNVASAWFTFIFLLWVVADTYSLYTLRKIKEKLTEFKETLKEKIHDFIKDHGTLDHALLADINRKIRDKVHDHLSEKIGKHLGHEKIQKMHSEIKEKIFQQLKEEIVKDMKQIHGSDISLLI